MIQRCRECGVVTGGLITAEQRGTTAILGGWPETDLCPSCVDKPEQLGTLCGFPIVVDHNFKAVNQEVVFGDFEDLVPQVNFKLDELPLEVLLRFKEQINTRIKELENEPS